MILTRFASLCFAVAIGQDRFAEPLVEGRLGTEEAGHQEVEQAPQLEDVVLDRSPREDETMYGLDTLDGLRQLGLRVLDDVTFIEDAVVPVDVLQARNVVPDDLIRSDHNVVGLELGQELVPFTRVPGVEDWLQVLRVLQDLIVPMTRERRWAHDE